MTVNASPEFAHAEKRYHQAISLKEKIACLEEMISLAPAHKGGENIRANLKSRLKKLKEKAEQAQKKHSYGGETIKKAELQAVLVGLTNSGKSSLLKSLTNASPQIAPYPYTTLTRNIGTLDYENIKIQIVDLPAVEHETFDQGITNTADLLLIVITFITDIEKIAPFLKKSIGNTLYLVNKTDTLTLEEKRKLEATLKSKKYNFIMVSAKTTENISELKKTIWESFKRIRIYTKTPGKPTDPDPVIFSPNATVKDIAEKVFHGLASNVIEAKVTGPSAKFPNQKVGLDHILKDKDIVEFKTK